MKKTIIKFFDKIIISLLGFLGMFTSCKHESDCNAKYFFDTYSSLDSGLVIMYGVLQADYEIKGKVTNKANAQSIANIQIIRQINEERGDTIYTNSEGKYLYRYIGFVPFDEAANATFYFKIEDIDGEENGGEYKTKEIEVKISQSDQVEPCPGFGSRYEKTHNIKLDKK